MVRSYLGKAYFEEKRDKQAGDQYEMSRQLDPKDPTPYFYDAIRKQTTNRPVEALQDMQKAIELNDNRAVYRSRLLLDSDLAARSAALSRIYSDLGFQQLGLVEGWKSVNTDPTNFSAHRFLADSYSALRRHEIARVSELLQSQLLQPLNMTPIQPRLAESNLFLVSAGGPAALSFNEFNPLFNRNGISFQTSGLAGERSTYSGEGVLSGIYKNLAFSVGGFHFQTDGWRKNADQNDTIANTFLQLEISPETSVQAEVRRRETTRGDIQQKFFPDVFARGLNDEIDSYNVRFGGRHSFSANSILLGSFMYQNRDQTQRNVTPSALIAGDLPQQALGFETQHLFRSRHFNVTSGIGYFDIDGKLGLTVTPPMSPPSFDAAVNLDIRHLNVYSYGNIGLTSNLLLTLGVSFDYINWRNSAFSDEDVRQFNPKAGLSWNIGPSTTVRASVSRSVKRTLITDQTLEPTHVSGFNQFFDDLNGTKAWQYGAAADHRFSQNLFAGAAFSRRDLNIPLLIPLPQDLHNFDGTEYFARTYLFWTPHPWWALRAEYQYEEFKNDSGLGEPKKINTHRVPLGVSVFHPSGVSAALLSTYYNHGGTFPDSSGALFRSGSSSFWILDAAVNYRLPKRHGFITVGANNLFDKKFRYFEVDRDNPRIQPKRMVFVKLTLALP